jgi:hypothetical protein
VETESLRFEDSQSTTRAPDAGSATSRRDDRQAESPKRVKEYERMLETSRVYTRVHRGPSEIDPMSIRGSTFRTTSSAFSEISLNHLSIISVYRLPITLNDINSIGAGLTFATRLVSSRLIQPNRLGPSRAASENPEIILSRSPLQYAPF